MNVAAVPPFFIFPSDYGSGKLPTYLMFFVIGFLMASGPGFEKTIEKNKALSLMLAIITSLLIIAASARTGNAPPSSELNASYTVTSTIWALNGWCWVTALLGYGRKYLSFNNRFLQISNELVLPFYILHQTVIVAVAYYVVGLNLLTIEKYLLIVITAFPIIVALLYPIRKINALRFLFGMKTIRPQVKALVQQI